MISPRLTPRLITSRACPIVTSHERRAWYQVVSFRNQGRYRDAGRAAQHYRELTLKRAPALHPYATPQAIVFWETGSPLRAAALLDTMFHNIGDLGRASRRRATRRGC